MLMRRVLFYSCLYKNKGLFLFTLNEQWTLKYYRGLDISNPKQLQLNRCVFFICIMNVSKYTQRKEKLFTFLIFNILQPHMWKQFTTGIFLVKENNSITRQKCSFDCKTFNHSCFPSWMSNKKVHPRNLWWTVHKPASNQMQNII